MDFDSVRELTVKDAWGNKLFLVKFPSFQTEFDWHVVPEYVLDDDYDSLMNVHKRIDYGDLGMIGSIDHDDYEGFAKPEDVVDGLARGLAKKKIKTAANKLQDEAANL